MEKTIKSYKGHEFFHDDSGLFNVRGPDGSLFVVGLDDSKARGNRRIIPEANTEQACRDYIDWVTGDPR